MIILMLKGGLGNQMFQYAAARKWAHAGNTELFIDSSNYNPQRNYRLDFFNIAAKPPAQKDTSRLTKKGIRYYAERLLLPYYKRSFVWERNWSFDQNLVAPTRNDVYLRGLFLSPEYFAGIEDVIQKELSIKGPMNRAYADMLARIKTGTSISIHIRRGDFLLPENLKIYENLGLDYYMHAIELIAEKARPTKLFIFSDDIAWAKENIKTSHPIEFVSGNGFEDYEEMSLMSACSHNIIANSTFSWWGAWLNPNPDKIVVAPKRWLVDDAKNAAYIEHLIPKDWITI